MRRVILFSSTEWAFGRIHSDLTKYLFTSGIDAELLPWNIGYSLEEFKEMDSVTDSYLTTTNGVTFLTDSYGVDPAKVVAVAHGIVDIEYLIKHKGSDAFNDLKEYGVVSKYLKEQSKRLGVKRIPKILPLGINVASFDIEPASELKVIGYAGDYNGFHKEIKRGALVEAVAKKTGLEFKVAKDYHHNFVTMPGFYNTVDCVIISSSEEGAGLPAMEAGAAGRLVVSTPVGHWPERIGELGGHTVPIDEKGFVTETVKILNKYKSDKLAFKKKCIEIKKHSENYDWSQVIDRWKEALEQ